jgi:hypothetical protein
MIEGNTITGEVIEIRSYGSIVLVFLDEGDGNLSPIPFDHRAFQCVLDGEVCSVNDLVGRRVSYDGDRLQIVE